MNAKLEKTLSALIAAEPDSEFEKRAVHAYDQAYRGLPTVSFLQETARYYPRHAVAIAACIEATKP